MILRGVATKVEVFAFDYSTGAPKTGDAANITVYVAKDHGTATVLGDTSATEVDSTNAKGVYRFDVTATEMDADHLLFTGKSSTANVAIVPREWVTTVSVMKRRNTAQAGASGTITLDASATTAHCQAGDWIYIESGSGAGNSNYVASFDATTKIATMIQSWGAPGNPSSSSVFQVWSAGGATPALVSDIWSDSANPARTITGGNISKIAASTVIGAGTVANPWRGA